MPLTLSDAYATKSKTELIEEIMRLHKELTIRNEENGMLKKRLLLYKSIR